MDRRSLIGFYDELDKQAGAAGAISTVLAPALLGTGLGAGIGALAGDKGDRWKSIRKGMLIGGGIGTGIGGGVLLGGYPGIRQQVKAQRAWDAAKDEDLWRVLSPEEIGRQYIGDTVPTALGEKLQQQFDRGALVSGLGGLLGGAAAGTAGGLGGAAVERKLRAKKKTAALQKIASLDLEWPEIIKLAAVDAEIYQLLKEAGLFSRIGKFMQRKGAPAIGRGVQATGRGIARGARGVGRTAKGGYQSLQRELGTAMAGAGRYGHHGGEIARGIPHAALAGAVKGGSPMAAAAHLAPEVAGAVAKPVTQAARRVVGRLRPPPPMRPAVAV